MGCNAARGVLLDEGLPDFGATHKWSSRDELMGLLGTCLIDGSCVN